MYVCIYTYIYITLYLRMFGSVLQSAAVQSSMAQRGGAVCCSVLQCVVVCCSGYPMWQDLCCRLIDVAFITL